MGAKVVKTISNMKSKGGFVVYGKNYIKMQKSAMQ